MNTLAELKKSRQSEAEKLTAKLMELTAKPKNTYEEDDDTYWYPSVDDAGNGSAIIRFLPAPKGEDVPFVRIFKHGFKNPETGLWYIENSLTTLGQKDPVGDYNSYLWNLSGDDSSPSRKQARDQKRKLEFVSNVYIVKDPANPENEGKVFKFRYGKKIFDKIQDSISPPEDEIEEVQSVNPFDLWGPNFKLRIRKLDGYRNYDKSEFDKVSKPLVDDEKELERIWLSCYSLAELIAPDKFKSYDELKARLNRVLGLNSEGDAITRPTLVESAEPRALKETPMNTSVDDDDFLKSLNLDD